MFKNKSTGESKKFPFFDSHFRVRLPSRGSYVQTRPTWLFERSMGCLVREHSRGGIMVSPQKIDEFQAVHPIPRQRKIPGFDCHVPIKVVVLGHP